MGARRQKFAAFENACSEVAPGLCVGGGAVAQASTMCSVHAAVAPDPWTQLLSLIRGDMLTCQPSPGVPVWTKATHPCGDGHSSVQNRETLRAAGVTHIVNCVGMLVPNCFTAEIDYLTLFLLGEAWSRTVAAAGPGRQYLKLSLLSCLPSM